MTLALRHRPVPDSPLARWDARWKLAAMLVAVAGVAAVDHVLPAAAALAVGLGLVVLARLPRRWARDRLLALGFAALPFVLVLTFTLATAGPCCDLGPVRVS